MGLTTMAVVTGLLLGLLAGGRLRHLAERTFRWWTFLLGGLALQVVSAEVRGAAGLGLLVASYVLLTAFATLNVTVVGMWLLALGVSLNLLTIAVNGGMPVRPSAVVAAGIVEREELPALDIDNEGKRHLERPSDRLMVISDVIPVRPLKQVVSFGDLLMAVGAGNVVYHLVRPPHRRTGPRDDDDAEDDAHNVPLAAG